MSTVTRLPPLTRTMPLDPRQPPKVLSSARAFRLPGWAAGKVRKTGHGSIDPRHGVTVGEPAPRRSVGEAIDGNGRTDDDRGHRDGRKQSHRSLTPPSTDAGGNPLDSVRPPRRSSPAARQCLPDSILHHHVVAPFEGTSSPTIGRSLANARGALLLTVPTEQSSASAI